MFTTLWVSLCNIFKGTVRYKDFNLYWMGCLSIALPQTQIQLQRKSGVDVAGGEGYGILKWLCFIDNAPWKVSQSLFLQEKKNWNKQHKDVQRYCLSYVRTTKAQFNLTISWIGNILRVHSERHQTLVQHLCISRTEWSVFSVQLCRHLLGNPFQPQFDSCLLGLSVNWLLWRSLTRCSLYQ